MTIRRNDALVTYVSRDLEPYRGVHSMIRALPHLLRARKNLKVVMLGGDGVSYGVPAPQGTTWRETFMREVADQIDPSRFHFRVGSITRSICRCCAGRTRMCI